WRIEMYTPKMHQTQRFATLKPYENKQLSRITTTIKNAQNYILTGSSPVTRKNQNRRVFTENA
ncbi:MAG: hypothetical protein J6S41_01865, partial [Clostridia bacterium]|nr:hypothetical protein [Clostridia bacterium]